MWSDTVARDNIKTVRSVAIDAVLITFEPQLEGRSVDELFFHFECVHKLQKPSSILDFTTYLNNRGIKFKIACNVKHTDPLVDRIVSQLRYIKVKSAILRQLKES